MSSIRGRLIVGLGLLCIVLWSAGGLAVYFTLRAGLVTEFDKALAANAQGLATLAEDSEGKIIFDLVGDLMPAYQRAERPDYFEVWLPDGSTLARSPSLRSVHLPLRTGTLDAPQCWNLTLPDGEPGRAAGVRFVPKKDDEAPDAPSAPGASEGVMLVIARHRADLDRLLNQLATVLLVVGAATAATTALLAALVVHRGMRPLSRLAGHVAAIDASSLQLRIPTDRMPSELLPIGRRLNDLLARLDASFTRERRFSADVAHELRTPIAELRALAEVSLKWPDDVDAARSALQDALSIALQMESIATRLLALARCEGGQLTVRPEPVPLGPLIDEIWKPLADRASAKKLLVTLSAPNGSCWRTDRVALRAILVNLLSNAVEYSPVAGAVSLRVEDDRGVGHVLISNTTEHLDPDDLPHLFDRFWQKDAARSSGSGHCGLGLALAKAYAESLGLSLRAELTRPHELTMELSVAGASASAE